MLYQIFLLTLQNDLIFCLAKFSRHRHLIDVCRTRWVARLDGLDVFTELYEAVAHCLEATMLNADGTWNTDSVRDACTLFHGSVSFSFIFCLVATSRCLEVTRPLTKDLQQTAFDVVAAHEVTLLFTSLQCLRQDADENHSLWYSEAVELAQLIGVEPSKPRTVQKQIYRDNMPSDSVTEYYKRNVTLPFLDHLRSQIQSHFSNRNVALLNGFYAFPSRVVSMPEWSEKFASFLEQIHDDLPEPRYINTELNMWEEYCKNMDTTPYTDLSALLPTIDKLSFPNIYAALAILGTVPVTTCSCERSISVLPRLKTYLRSTMKNDRLNGLALLNIHREIELNVEEIIDKFAMRRPRKMTLINMWEDKSK